jgi:hypothetical protein
MSKIKELPSQEYLKECFEYDAETGTLTWKQRPRHHFKSDVSMNIFNSTKQNKVAGDDSVNQYKNVAIGGCSFKQHRIIWKLVTGEDPKGVIDHKNKVKSDNRFINLRDVNVSENNENRNIDKSNTSGYIGVSLYKLSGRYRARKSVDGVRYDLGFFDTAHEANEALLKFNISNNYKSSVSKQKSILDVTYSLLDSLFYYEDGFLFWKPRACNDVFSNAECEQFNKQFANTKAGCKSNKYIVIKSSVFGAKLAHRLIYQLCHKLDKLDTDLVVDHIDNNPENNKIDNLRLVTRSQNAWNSRKLKISDDNPYKGVTRKNGRWTANISKDRVQKNLGMFDTPELAHAAYCKAASELHKEYANFGN